MVDQLFRNSVKLLSLKHFTECFKNAPLLILNKSHQLVYGIIYLDSFNNPTANVTVGGNVSRVRTCSAPDQFNDTFSQTGVPDQFDATQYHDTSSTMYEMIFLRGDIDQLM